MHFQFEITLLGLIIFGLWLYGIYRGYKRGAITMVVSLSVLFIGLILAALLGRLTDAFFYSRSNVPQLFGAIVLLIIFTPAIFLSNTVQKKVFNKVNDPEDKTSEIIGAALGLIKYFVITGVFSLSILYMNMAGSFLPENERDGFLMQGSAWVMKKTMRVLDYPVKTVGPQQPKPNNINVISPNPQPPTPQTNPQPPNTVTDPNSPQVTKIDDNKP